MPAAVDSADGQGVAVRCHSPGSWCAAVLLGPRRDEAQGVIAMASTARRLTARVRQVQRIVLRANMALTLLQFAFWATLLGVPVLLLLRAPRRESVGRPTPAVRR